MTARGRYYILDADNRVQPVDDILTWGRWWEIVGNRIVGKTQINSEITVSTVFLGIDHRGRDDGPPILFETMIFGGLLSDKQWRYSSWDDAENGHAAAVRMAHAAAGQKIKQESKP